MLRLSLLSALSRSAFAGQQAASFATASKDLVAKKDWNAVQLPPQTVKDIPTSTGGAAFPGDLRSTSGLGLGDGLKTHTDKWLQVRAPAGPMQPR